MKKILITAGEVTVQAELNESSTALQIWQSLPVEGRANVWGDEIYFGIPVTADLEQTARQDLEVGELGYWPVGRAFCIFFGPTPVSINEKPRAYSPVNIVGQILGDAAQFRQVRDGTVVRLSRAGE